MLPRKSSIGRGMMLLLFCSFSLWIWVENIRGSSTSDIKPWQDLDIHSILMEKKVPSVSPKNLSKLRSHHHSNQSLEELRKNMTLINVNMSGLMDRIKQANGSSKMVLHGPAQHVKVPNPHDFKYIINSPVICKNRKDLFAIVYVHTAPSHYKRRMIIRQTWGNPKYYEVTIRIVFVMGYIASDIEAQRALEFENDQYHDIVQEDFQDSYKNLTYKGIAALKWIDTYCRNAKFVIKTDDDIFVNMFTLLRHLISMEKYGTENKSIILCLVWYRMKVMRDGKWKVGEDEFKDEYYPTYCSGSAFTLTMSAVIRLHEVSYHVPFFWVDDFYITGLLPLKAGNVTHKQFMSTYVLDGRKLEEKFTGPQWFTYIFSHVHDLNLIQSVWDRLVQLAKGTANAKIKYALPGELPNEKEIRRKEAEEEQKRADQRKKDEEEKKKKAEADKIAKDIKKPETIEKKENKKEEIKPQQKVEPAKNP